MSIDPHDLRSRSRRIERTADLEVLIPTPKGPLEKVPLRLELSSTVNDPSAFHARFWHLEHPVAGDGIFELWESADTAPIDHIRADSLDVAEMAVWQWLGQWLDSVGGRLPNADA
jgi:hypothetical protein